MFRNYILITFRNFIRQKWYSIINLLGLTAGLTAAMLILVFVIHEFSYDRFHQQPENIYRVITNINMGGREQTFALSQTPLGPELNRKYPEFASYTRIHRSWNSILISKNGSKFYEKNIISADSSFFETFNFKIIQGNPEKMLTRPYTMVLTESMANKYFPNSNAMGKVLTVNNNKDYEITGIIEDPPSNSHFTFDGISSFATLYQGGREKWMDSWIGNINYYTYLKTNGSKSVPELEKLINQTVLEKAGQSFEDYGFSLSAKLQSITDIHLHSDFEHEIEPQGDIKYVYIFIAIGIFILVIASINFMNLSTARSAKRAQEVGIRKVVGSKRSLLIFQFLGESQIYSILSFVLAIFLTIYLLPFFGHIMNRELLFSFQNDFTLVLLFFFISVLVGLLSGFYPAFYLSRFKPTKVLKGELTQGKSGASFRNILVVAQFSISIILIISTLTVYNQLSYIQNKKLGYDKESIIIAPLRITSLQDKISTIKSQVENIPGVIKTSASQNYFGNSFSGNAYRFEGMADNETLLMSYIEVDYDFFDLYKMQFMKGRGFSEEFGTDEKSVVMNEAAAKLSGVDNILNSTVWAPDSTEYKVIGIVKDFHFQSLRQSIEPVMILPVENNLSYLSIKVQNNTIAETIDRLEQKWQEIDNSRPFDYFFLDEKIDHYYQQESRLGKMYLYFSVLAIFIALLGLFGLSAYMTEQKYKEIGVRKVFGASINSIVLKLSRNFLKLVLISNILAWPISYLLMKKWLENFAYKEGIAWWTFAFAALLSLGIAFITVSIQSYRAAATNPAESLQNE